MGQRAPPLLRGPPGPSTEWQCTQPAGGDRHLHGRRRGGAAALHVCPRLIDSIQGVARQSRQAALQSRGAWQHRRGGLLHRSSLAGLLLPARMPLPETATVRLQHGSHLTARQAAPAAHGRLPRGGRHHTSADVRHLRRSQRRRRPSGRRRGGGGTRGGGARGGAAGECVRRAGAAPHSPDRPCRSAAAASAGSGGALPRRLYPRDDVLQPGAQLAPRPAAGLPRLPGVGAPRVGQHDPSFGCGAAV
mmetsp:Transcript_24604/g.61031  ORF Transcript_24604/g.61031 Transcript_24604/m.61031 type:complete len:247 (+) Transcript_24604:285-1025(+)